MKTNKKGISLIVLVITIIVMIILATAVILSLDGSDIIGEANKAVKKYDLANAKTVVALADAEWQLMSEAEKEEEGNFSTYATSKLAEAGYVTGTETGALEVSEEGNIYAYPTIPTGFVVSPYEGETKVSEGLVIYEASTLSGVAQATAMTDYNQFVWIPVDDIDNFKRSDWGMPGSLSGEDLTKYSMDYDSNILSESQEYEKMKTSVEKYGGFYMGRYEAGLPRKFYK